ncbi:hypothetical protein ACKXGF_02880 [Alkalibacillus sp. S2W]|uniref:hypothetical protein n=1 Tax=Alkalibacillus sp. S2W TaxID=3386553 RepID=UPI00398D67E0
MKEHDNSNNYQPIRDNVATNDTEQKKEQDSQKSDNEENTDNKGFFQNMFSYVSSFFQSLMFWV